MLNIAPLRKEHLEFFTKYWGHETMTSWNDNAESHASVWQHTLIIKKILQRLETKGALYAMFQITRCKCIVLILHNGDDDACLVQVVMTLGNENQSNIVQQFTVCSSVQLEVLVVGVQPLVRFIIIIMRDDSVSIYLNRRVCFWFGSPTIFIINSNKFLYYIKSDRRRRDFVIYKCIVKTKLRIRVLPMLCHPSWAAIWTQEGRRRMPKRSIQAYHMNHIKTSAFSHLLLSTYICSWNQYLVKISFRQFAKFSGVKCDAYFIWQYNNLYISYHYFQ